MKSISGIIRPLIIAMGILMSHVVMAQHIKSDAYKRNHKLNKDYLQELSTDKTSPITIMEAKNSSATGYVVKNRKLNKHIRLSGLLLVPVKSSKCYHYKCRNHKLQASRSSCAACDKPKK